MSSLGDRERAFDSSLEQDEELKFRLAARRNRLLGEWAASKMGLSDVETDSYTKDVIRADFEETGDEVVIRKILGDLTAAGVETDDVEIRRALENNAFEARRQLIEAHGAAGA